MKLFCDRIFAWHTSLNWLDNTLFCRHSVMIENMYMFRFYMIQDWLASKISLFTSSFSWMVSHRLPTSIPTWNPHCLESTWLCLARDRIRSASATLSCSEVHAINVGNPIRHSQYCHQWVATYKDHRQMIGIYGIGGSHAKLPKHQTRTMWSVSACDLARYKEINTSLLICLWDILLPAWFIFVWMD